MPELCLTAMMCWLAATSSPPTLTSLQWHGTNGTSISVSIMVKLRPSCCAWIIPAHLPPPHPPLQLPVPTVLCHCSGPLVINVSYSNETSTFYTSFVLLEYRSDVTSYDRTLILDKAECWRQYNVSVAYQSPTDRALFSRAITLDNSELSMSDWCNLDYPHNHCSKSISICAGLT